MSLVSGCNNTVLSRAQLYQYANKAGFSGGAADTIVAIAFAESGANTCSWNPSDPYGGSFGVLQINGAHFGANNMSQSCALDPQCAFNFAHGLWSAQGFQPWGTFTNGSYKPFLQAGNTSAIGSSTGGQAQAQASAPGGFNPLDPLGSIGPTLKQWGEYIAIFLLAIALIIIGFILLAEKQAGELAGAAVKAAKVAAV